MRMSSKQKTFNFKLFFTRKSRKKLHFIKHENWKSQGRMSYASTEEGKKIKREV